MSDTGYIGLNFLDDMWKSVFGSLQTIGVDPLVLRLGTAITSPTYYSATASVPNNDAHWIFLTGTQYGATNANLITFSPLTSGDVGAWDHSGISVTPTTGSPSFAQVCTAIHIPLTGFLITPYAGLEIAIGPQSLVWTFN